MVLPPASHTAAYAKLAEQQRISEQLSVYATKEEPALANGRVKRMEERARVEQEPQQEADWARDKKETEHEVVRLRERIADLEREYLPAPAPAPALTPYEDSKGGTYYRGGNGRKISIASLEKRRKQHREYQRSVRATAKQNTADLRKSKKTVEKLKFVNKGLKKTNDQ
jgi:hypothetical protein